MQTRAKRTFGGLSAAFVAGSVCCIAGGGIPVAHAQTASEIATAKRWFAGGLAHEEKGEFAAALELFRRAVQVKKTPQIVYHVGFCESRTGALVEALVDLDGAAAIARGAHADDVVVAAQAELAEVKKRVPSLEVRVAGDGSAARFIVDGSAIALSMLRTPMPLDPGEHTVTIELASGASVTRKVTLAERDAKTLELAPPAAAQASTPAPTPSGAPPAPPPAAASEENTGHAAHHSTTAEWVLVGVGAALVVGGASLFAVARVKEGSLNGSCPSHTDCDPSLESTYNAATTLNSVGIGLAAVGIAAAGLGVSLLVVRSSSPGATATTATTATTLGVSPRGFLLTTSF